MCSCRDNVTKAINWIIANREDGSPSKFSRTLDVSTPKTNNWRKGYNAPDLEMCGHIARTYHVSFDWLIGGDASKAPADFKGYDQTCKPRD